MGYYRLAIFLGAFLLFLVQPLIGKFILPWHGGSPAVWTTCMLFFQVVLFAGYCYAHGSVRFLSLQRQGLVHLTLLVLSLMLLPIIPDPPANSTESLPSYDILWALFASAGVPYFMLSATAPLLQSWYHRSFETSPYRLYALSNVASLGALFSYPLIVERFLRLQAQAWIWTFAYSLFAVVCGSIAFRIYRSHKSRPDSPSVDSTDDSRPRRLDILFWLCYSAAGSVLLLTTTNQLTIDVASVPFLWVLPLAIYVLTFVICFDAEHWYQRRLFNVLIMLSTLTTAFAMFRHMEVSMIFSIAAFCFSLFTGCMVCHGELVRRKPTPRYLTMFYLMVSLGGACGGVLVTLIVPQVFVQLSEFPISIGLCCLLALVGPRYERWRQNTVCEANSLGDPLRYVLRSIAVCLMLIFLVNLSLDQKTSSSTSNGTIARRRNFYGVLKVERQDVGIPDLDRITISHGTTQHGFQFQSPTKKREATSYYVPESGVGLALNRHPKRLAGGKLRIGVIGLGCGVLSTYAEAGDYLRYYEINPQVAELSSKFFSFQADADQRGVDQHTEIGDARIVLQRQLARKQQQNFDVLVVDAFSSDSIPIHLLTKECFEVYLGHLSPSGILAFHLSNRYLDLIPIVQHHANSNRQSTRFVRYEPSAETNRWPSEWMLCTKNNRFLSDAQVLEKSTGCIDLTPVIWTDDFSNLFSVMR